MVLPTFLFLSPLPLILGNPERSIHHCLQEVLHPDNTCSCFQNGFPSPASHGAIEKTLLQKDALQPGAKAPPPVYLMEPNLEG